MRILLLSLSLFFAQNALTNDTMIESMKAMAPGIALSVVGGTITELLYSLPTDQWTLLDPVHPFAAIVTSTLCMATTIYNLEKLGYEYAAPLIAVPTFFAAVYSYCTAVKGIKYVKRTLLNWYKKYKNEIHKEIV